MWRWVTLENFRFEPCCSLWSPAICFANIGMKCVRLFLDVQRCSRICAGEAQRDVAQLCDMMCAKAILTPLKIMPQIWWLEQLQSSIQVLCPRFYTLEFSKILKCFGALTYLQLLYRMCIIFSHFRNKFTSILLYCEKEESEDSVPLWRNELFCLYIS